MRPDDAAPDDSRPGLTPWLDRIDLMRGDIAELRHGMATEQAAIRKDMAEGFATLRVQVADMRADLMKWSFGFWVGAVLAIAALAGVLRWRS